MMRTIKQRGLEHNVSGVDTETLMMYAKTMELALTMANFVEEEDNVDLIDLNIAKLTSPVVYDPTGNKLVCSFEDGNGTVRDIELSLKPKKERLSRVGIEKDIELLQMTCEGDVLGIVRHDPSYAHRDIRNGLESGLRSFLQVDS